MEIKGNIGDEVWVRAKIKRVTVDDSGVLYMVEIRDRQNGLACVIDVNDTDIKVRKADALAAAMKAAGAAPVVPDAMYISPAGAVPRETDQEPEQPEEIKDCKFCKHDTVTSTVCNGCEDFDKFEPLPEGQEEADPVSEIWEGVKCDTCAFKDRRGSEPPCNVCNSDFSAWAPIPDGVKRKTKEGDSRRTDGEGQEGQRKERRGE